MNFRTAPLYIVLLPTLALAETPDSTATYPRSIGFEDPDELSGLLEYRLPDWTWYTWDATLGLNATGRDQPDQRDSEVSSSLGTTYSLHRETDPRQWSVSATLDGSLSRTNVDRDPPGVDRYDRRVRTSATLSARITEYFVDWFGVTASGGTGGGYFESKTEVDTLPGTLFVERRFGSQVFGGVTFGRTRNVDPVLRARRISERLVELGRPALAPAELRSLADRIARRSGYIEVFDRSEKYFWASLLEEITGGQTLPARDLLYLLEVFDESYGLREQGLRADVGVGYSGTRTSGDPAPTSRDYLFAPRVQVSWYENLSLEHQLRAGLIAEYQSVTVDRIDEDRRLVQATIGDLLLLTDRWRWTNDLNGLLLSRRDGRTDEWIESTEARLNSSLVVFVEDRLALSGTFRLNYRSQESYNGSLGNVDLQTRESWDWSVSASLSYQIGQGIY